MKKIAIFLLLLLMFPFCACEINHKTDDSVDMTPRLISSTQVLSSSEIVENVKGAIVGIACSISNGTSIGSGVAVANGGYVLTNHHVISGARKITLYLANSETVSAKLLWSDSALDIAILKSAVSLPYLDYVSLDEVEVGDDVLAIGTPISLQFQQTVTKGIVSAKNRTLELSSLGGLTTYMQNLIQHDASINGGNSGGPLINSMGKIIGINSLKASDAEGIGFAIPIETAMSAVEKIVPTGSFQQVHLGIFGCDAENANVKNLTTFNEGVYVLDIEKNSVSEKNNLPVGSVISEINGKKISNMIDFRKAIYSLNQDEKIKIKYFDNNQEKEIII